MGKVIGYAVIRESGNRFILSGLMVGQTREEAEAILVVGRIDYPNINKNSRIVELHEIETEETPNASL